MQLPQCVSKNLSQTGFPCSGKAFGRSSTCSRSLGSLSIHFLYFRLGRKVLTPLCLPTPLLLPAASSSLSTKSASGCGTLRPSKRLLFGSSSSRTYFRTRTIQTTVFTLACELTKTEGAGPALLELPRTPAPLSPECGSWAWAQAAHRRLAFQRPKQASVHWNSSLPPVGKGAGGESPSGGWGLRGRGTMNC